MNAFYFWLNFCASGKFPETAWRADHSRQAAHAIGLFFGFLKRNCLAAHSQPPGEAWCFTQF